MCASNVSQILNTVIRNPCESVVICEDMSFAMSSCIMRSLLALTCVTRVFRENFFSGNILCVFHWFFSGWIYGNEGYSNDDMMSKDFFFLD